MAKYTPSRKLPDGIITAERMLQNQVTFYGTDQSISVQKGTFLLTTLVADGSGSVTIKDGDGNTMLTGVTSFTQDHVPLRCDSGIQITGDVAFAVGSAFPGVFNE